MEGPLKPLQFLVSRVSRGEKKPNQTKLGRRWTSQAGRWVASDFYLRAMATLCKRLESVQDPTSQPLGVSLTIHSEQRGTPTCGQLLPSRSTLATSQFLQALPRSSASQGAGDGAALYSLGAPEWRRKAFLALHSRAAQAHCCLYISRDGGDKDTHTHARQETLGKGHHWLATEKTFR